MQIFLLCITPFLDVLKIFKYIVTQNVGCIFQNIILLYPRMFIQVTTLSNVPVTMPSKRPLEDYQYDEVAEKEAKLVKREVKEEHRE